jgi:hypothetical protein
MQTYKSALSAIPALARREYGEALMAAIDDLAARIDGYEDSSAILEWERKYPTLKVLALDYE